MKLKKGDKISLKELKEKGWKKLDKTKDSFGLYGKGKDKLLYDYDNNKVRVVWN